MTQQLAGHGVRKLSRMSIISGIHDMPRVAGVDRTPVIGFYI